ncbi:MAG: aminotransferase class III-fold pyridoxal phosphate-dependent enzyme, partial [Thaumarchaeota archaeon]|nr:aminotransferase class III-fold pyridoxal phosphate-dependent enzyme [Nitrososphaerota archaeon]
PEDTSHMLVEPIQGDGGDVVPPPGYFEKLKRICSKNGILFAVDEAKTGLGRTGKMFAMEHSDGIVPDAIALGKGVGGGIPLGALIARRELLDTAFVATSFSGSAIGSAAGLALINIIERDKLAEHAGKMGERILSRLNEMKTKHRLIGDVRGKGLVIGVELVSDQKKKTAAKAEALETVRQAWKLGVLLTLVGPEHNVIEMTPPLNISEEDVDFGIDCFDRALSIVERAS